MLKGVCDVFPVTYLQWSGHSVSWIANVGSQVGSFVMCFPYHTCNGVVFQSSELQSLVLKLRQTELETELLNIFG